MKTKRVIISLREDEVQLLSTILTDYLITVPTNEPGVTAHSSIQEQAQKLLRDSVQKLVYKLEAKNER